MSLEAKWEDREHFDPYSDALGIERETVLAIISDADDPDAVAVVYTVISDDGPVMWRATVLNCNGVLRVYGLPVEIPDGMEKFARALEAQVASGPAD